MYQAKPLVNSTQVRHLLSRTRVKFLDRNQGPLVRSQVFLVERPQVYQAKLRQVAERLLELLELPELLEPPELLELLELLLEEASLQPFLVKSQVAVDKYHP